MILQRSVSNTVPGPIFANNLSQSFRPKPTTVQPKTDCKYLFNNEICPKHH